MADAASTALLDAAEARSGVGRALSKSSDKDDVERGPSVRSPRAKKELSDPPRSPEHKKEPIVSPRSPKHEKKKGPTIDGVILPREDQEEASFFARLVGLHLPSWVYGVLVMLHLALIGFAAYGVYQLFQSPGASPDTSNVDRQSTVKSDAKDVNAPISKVTEGSEEAGKKAMNDKLQYLSKVNHWLDMSQMDSTVVEKVKSHQATMIEVLDTKGLSREEMAKKTREALHDFAGSLNAARDYAMQQHLWTCDLIKGAQATEDGCECPTPTSLEPTQTNVGAARCMAGGERTWSKDTIGGLIGVCECARKKTKGECRTFASDAKAHGYAAPEHVESGYGRTVASIARGAQPFPGEFRHQTEVTATGGWQCRCRTEHRKDWDGAYYVDHVLQGESCSQRNQAFFNVLDSDKDCKCVEETRWFRREGTFTPNEAIMFKYKSEEIVAHYQIVHMLMSTEVSRQKVQNLWSKNNKVGTDNSYCRNMFEDGATEMDEDEGKCEVFAFIGRMFEDWMTPQ